MDDEDMDLDKLIDAARNEDWDFVDGRIGQVCNDDVYLIWARHDGFNSDDGNLRDLAVSIYEKTDRGDFFDEDTKKKLREKMLNDSNPYVRYRAAFALFAHGDRSKDVAKVLIAAANDNEVGEIARCYLEKARVRTL